MTLLLVEIKGIIHLLPVLLWYEKISTPLEEKSVFKHEVISYGNKLNDNAFVSGNGRSGIELLPAT